jgi:hypothetical protein
LEFERAKEQFKHLALFLEECIFCWEARWVVLGKRYDQPATVTWATTSW